MHDGSLEGYSALHRAQTQTLFFSKNVNRDTAEQITAAEDGISHSLRFCAD